MELRWRIAPEQSLIFGIFPVPPNGIHFPKAPCFLLTEALRGEGAVLKNMEGKAFMSQYHPMADLAPRDIVSRAIVSEMRKSGSRWVYLDATSIGRKKLRARFPTIYEFLQQYDLDLSIDLIPVSPSAHYWMGGVLNQSSCTDIHSGTLRCRRGCPSPEFTAPIASRAIRFWKV